MSQRKNQVEAIGDYGYQNDTHGTGLTYEDYVASVMAGKAMPKWMWESLPDPPSVEANEELKQAKLLRQQDQYRKKAGGFIPGPMLSDGPKIYQVYADPYLNAGTMPPHYHDPQGKPWIT